MANYNLKNLFHLSFCSFFRNTTPGTKLTFGRVVFLILFNIVWIPIAILHQILYRLDPLFYPKLKNQKIEKPFFIVGNFRNGTTMVQRLLAKDTKNFACMKTWELYVAPMLIENRFFHAMSKIDHDFFGGLVHKILHRFDNFTSGHVKIHQVGMFEPEEDETLFLHIWRSFFIRFLFPFHDDLPDYLHFDEAFSEKEKTTVMNYYKEMVKRYMFANKRSKYYLSKNPSITARIKSLKTTFPDARFLYLMRDPLETVPSTISWFSYCYGTFGDYDERYPYLRETIDTTNHLIHYGLEMMDALPKEQALIIEYKNLVADLEGTIKNIYEYFNLELDDNFETIVHQVSEINKNYTSSHVYDLDKMGTSEEEIREIFSDIYDRFEF